MRRVKLPRGGALTIDEAEAATLIDVDAEESRAAPPALNRAAVPAVAAALRLRGIGGQVLVDFVRGGGAKDRDAVVAALRAAVADDPEPVEIAGWSRLGLLELTRRRSRPSLASLLAAPMSDRPAAVVARAYDALRAAARTGAGAGVSTVAITAGREVADALTGPLAEDLAALAAAAAVRLDVVRDPTLGPTDFRAAPSRPQGGRE
ncbi:MAG: ribonuclease E/G, partial [Alphaproteobacteria bacterium]